GITGFCASNGWLYRFRKRHNVLFTKLHGESADVDEETVSAWKDTILPNKLEGYAAKDIYNAAECGLFFNVLPDKTLVLDKRDSQGGKTSKARITVLLAANGDGSDKLTPFTIGKSSKPRCFKNIRSLPCTYKSQPKAWMTGDLFIEWLKQVDGKMRAQRRQILLFIDNCPAHPTDLQFLTNVKVEFFPKNCTSMLQPLDQGVIHNFKYFYRKRVVLRLMNFLDQPNVTNKDMMLNMLQALHFLQSSQTPSGTVSVTLASASVRMSRDGLLLPPTVPGAAAAGAGPAGAGRRRIRARVPSQVEERLAEDEEVDVDEAATDSNSEGAEAELTEAIEVEEDVHEMWASLSGRFGVGDLSVEQFIHFDDDVCTHEPLTEEQIMNMGSVEEMDADSDVEEDEQPDAEERRITRAEGLHALRDA
ncbi:Tigger transposable element-derived protein 6, partial [Frankliniella fusca]